ncbi:hypothetical protein LCGC14_1469730 [marine sediment metagenome]|uniref:Uncharacterized protein n=1 Tax=marine sediment metagenome TaxID=412755 RepID=A0A0F9MEI7_9ZZZZ
MVDLEKCKRKAISIFRGFCKVSTEESCIENNMRLDVEVNSTQKEALEDYDKYLEWLLDEDIDDIVLMVHRI